MGALSQTPKRLLLGTSLIGIPGPLRIRNRDVTWTWDGFDHHQVKGYTSLYEKCTVTEYFAVCQCRKSTHYINFTDNSGSPSMGGGSLHSAEPDEVYFSSFRAEAGNRAATNLTSRCWPPGWCQSLGWYRHHSQCDRLCPWMDSVGWWIHWSISL